MNQEMREERTCQIQDSVDASIHLFDVYVEKQESVLITNDKNDTGNTMTNRMTITRKHKWEEKQ